MTIRLSLSNPLSWLKKS